jgi:hypothetical protein
MTRRAHNFRDLTGQRFGRLVALALHPERSRFGQTRWVCRCDCGSERIVCAGSLTSGLSKSCNCIRNERIAKLKYKHGLCRSRVYWCWKNMKARCFYARHRAYRWYGGRGITVSERWLIFKNFYADMGDPPPGMSLDRIDPDGNYERTNCRWATVAEQLANRRPRRHPKRRRKRSSVAQLQRYVAAVSREAAP